MRVGSFGRCTRILCALALLVLGALAVPRESEAGIFGVNARVQARAQTRQVRAQSRAVQAQALGHQRVLVVPQAVVPFGFNGHGHCNAFGSSAFFFAH